MKDKWTIWVAGYGTFAFEGTEDEAEEMRTHKARWEGGRGEKWRTSNQRPSDLLTEEIVDLWDSGQGVPQSLLTKRKAAREAEKRNG